MTCRTTIVNLRQVPSAFPIDRTSIFGNPFTHISRSRGLILVPSRESAIDAHRIWLLQGFDALPEELRRRIPNPIVRELAFRRDAILLNLETLRKERFLGCWCKPLACHGDNYIELLGLMDDEKG